MSYVSTRYKGIVEDLVRHRLSKVLTPVEVSNLLSRRISSKEQRQEHLKLFSEVIDLIKQDIDNAHEKESQ